MALPAPAHSRPCCVALAPAALGTLKGEAEESRAHLAVTPGLGDLFLMGNLLLVWLQSDTVFVSIPAAWSPGPGPAGSGRPVCWGHVCGMFLYGVFTQYV